MNRRLTLIAAFIAVIFNMRDTEIKKAAQKLLGGSVSKKSSYLIY
jgi:hypothetical protein